MEAIKIILEYILPYKRWVWKAVVLTIVSTAISLCPPLILRAIIDKVITAGRMDLFYPLILLFLAVPALATVIGFANNYFIGLIGHKLVLDLRRKLYEHFMYLPLKFYDKQSTGTLIERIMTDVSKLQQMITTQTITLATDIVAATVAFVIMFSLNWRLTLLLALFVPLYVLNYNFFVARTKYMREALRTKVENITSNLNERLAGMVVVKAFGSEQTESERLASEALEAKELGVRVHGYHIIFGSTSNLLYWFSQTGVYVIGCYLVIQQQMSLGSVIAFTSYCIYILNPIVRFSAITNTVEHALVSVRRIKEVLSEQKEEKEPPDAISVRRFKGEVRFEDVCFEYESNQPVLHNFSLDVKAGMKIALVGHTGCGKTTVISLLMRFYKPTSGRILIDGIDLQRFSNKTLRENIAFVPQEPVLFEGTVFDNIAYGRKGVSEKDLIEAAKLADIHHVIEALPEGYKTLIGEEGVKLSVGEKQRITIARAILMDPAILIFDEATSSLDTESERQLQRTLLKVMEGRTSFIIAHRLATIISADLIVVMDKGRIVELGTHSELLKKRGYYHRLYTNQFAVAA